jgi:hypothetical protein
LVEQTLRDIAASTQVIAGGEIIEGGGGGGPFPTSGIIGWVKATGDGAGNPAYIQLLNPADSGVNVFIYEFYVSFIAHATAATCYAMRTDAPVTLVDPLEAALQRLDEQDVTAIQSQLLGGNDGGAVIVEADGQFYIPAGAEEGQDQFRPWPLRTVGETPLVLQPGESLELSADDDDVLTTIRAWVVVDEIPV